MSVERAGIPGAAVDRVLLDAATVADLKADWLHKAGRREASGGARAVADELRRLAGCGTPACPCHTNSKETDR